MKEKNTGVGYTPIQDEAVPSIAFAIQEIQQAIINFSQGSEVKYGTTKYKYTSYQEMMKQTMTHFKKHQILVVHNIIRGEGFDGNRASFLKTTLISLKDGTRFESTFDIDGEFRKSNPQIKDIGANITYAKRYNLISLLGVGSDGENEDQEIGERQVKNKAHVAGEVAEYIKNTSADELADKREALEIKIKDKRFDATKEKELLAQLDKKVRTSPNGAPSKAGV